MSDRYRLIHRNGLCYHGCGESLANPRNRFVNGHDSKLLDILLDAHKVGQRITVVESETAGGVVMSAQHWAYKAFFPQGYRWFLVKAGIEPHAYDEIQGIEDPDSRNLYMGNAADVIPAVDERDAQLDEAERMLADMDQRIKELEAGLAVALGAPVSDDQVFALMHYRLRDAAAALRGSRYDGAARDVWALAAVFANGRGDPIVARAGRKILGAKEEQ